MTNTVLLDIDPVLLDRIQRLVAKRGWGQHDGLIHLIEHGLFACEAETKARFSDTDAMALQAAINALQGIPDDPGFSLIGRVEPATTGDA